MLRTWYCRPFPRESQFTTGGMHVPLFATMALSNHPPTTNLHRLLKTSLCPDRRHGVPPRPSHRYRRDGHCGHSHDHRLGCAGSAPFSVHSCRRVRRSDLTFPVTKIRLLSILASKPGLESVQGVFPDLEVTTMFCFTVSFANLISRLRFRYGSRQSMNNSQPTV